MLSDLVEHLRDLPDDYQAKVWKLVADWAATASDADKAVVRERIRVATLSRRAARRAKKAREAGVAVLSAEATAAYAMLEPTDLLHKHEWLFREAWVDESADDIYGDDEMDFRKREERTSAKRAAACVKCSTRRALTA